LRKVTDRPLLVAQTAEKLKAYLLDVATSGNAKDLSDKMGSYCTLPPTENEGKH
jgi:hypothetical protein